MRRLARKGVVFRAGDEGAVLYRLQAGLVRMVEILPDGRLIAVRHVLPGDFFGEEALEGRPYRYTAEAMTEAAVEGYLPEGMGLEGWRQVARSLARQMAWLQAYGTHLQTGYLRARITRYLLFLAQTPALAWDGRGPYLAISHEEIAQATASLRESVSKLLMEMRREGLVATGYRRVYLLGLRGPKAGALPAFPQASPEVLEDGV